VVAKDPAISQTPAANKNTTIHAAADSNIWIIFVSGRFSVLAHKTSSQNRRVP